MTDAKPSLQGKVEDSLKKTRTVKVDEGERTAGVMQRAVDADPVLRNAMNQEPWWQSGVGVFGAGGLLWAVGVLMTEIGSNGLDIGSYDVATVVAALGSLVSAVGVLYRRYVPGLRPMFDWFGKE